MSDPPRGRPVPPSPPLSRLLPTRRGRLAAALASSIIGLGTLGASPAVADPASIASQRAEVARIQSQLDEYARQVEIAAEEYNGAVYRLDGVRTRLRESQARLNESERDLAQARVVLAQRLRYLYSTPQPSLAEVLLTSTSITEAVDRVDLLDTVGAQDARVVDTIRDSRDRLRVLRAELAEEKLEGERQVAAKEAQRARIAGLLRERQAVLDGARGELGRLLAAEERRQAAEAARQAAIAAARQRSAAAAEGAAPAAAAAPSAAAPSVAAPAAPVSLPSGGGNASAASIAMRYLGVPYVWGGASPSGFDCSGLVSYSFAQIGKSVPHYTVAIYNQFPKVPRDQLQPGDLVFFHGLGHMGIYLGGDQFVHAPRTGDVVKVSRFSTYSGCVGAVRP